MWNRRLPPTHHQLRHRNGSVQRDVGLIPCDAPSASPKPSGEASGVSKGGSIWAFASYVLRTFAASKQGNEWKFPMFQKNIRNTKLVDAWWLCQMTRGYTNWLAGVWWHVLLSLFDYISCCLIHLGKVWESPLAWYILLEVCKDPSWLLGEPLSCVLEISPWSVCESIWDFHQKPCLELGYAEAFGNGSSSQGTWSDRFKRMEPKRWLPGLNVV